MDIFDVLTMIGGLSLFLFGMNLMGEALERAAGNSLRTLLGKLTTSRMLGFFTGLAVTAVIQSSSATTVMVVGFVNSGLLSLAQAINVIMGANVGRRFGPRRVRGQKHFSGCKCGICLPSVKGTP